MHTLLGVISLIIMLSGYAIIVKKPYKKNQKLLTKSEVIGVLIVIVGIVLAIIGSKFI